MQNLVLSKLQNLCAANRLPHALIFLSPDLNHGLTTAKVFSQWLLCSNKQESIACGQCRSCTLFIAATHPDYCLLTPLPDKQIIGIDEVRGLLDFSIGQPQISQQKIGLIFPAQAMHIQSANALLKTLEEAPGSTIYILVCPNKDLLPITIVSRCQVLDVAGDTAISADLKNVVQSIAKDLLQIWGKQNTTTSQIVEQWIKQWPHEVLYWFDVVLTDVIRFKYTGDQQLTRVWCAEVAEVSKVIPDHKFWAILEKLRRAQYLLGHNLKPNLQLLIEDMLLV